MKREKVLGDKTSGIECEREDLMPRKLNTTGDVLLLMGYAGVATLTIVRMVVMDDLWAANVRCKLAWCH